MIIENNVLSIPLYHGTCRLFQDSIKTHGLGAVNPLVEYSVLPFVEQVFELCYKVLSGDSEWESCNFVPRWIINQESYSDFANFEHGDTYLTPSRACAVSYALTNLYGSEMLTQGYRLFTLAMNKCTNLVEESGLNKHPVVSLLNSNPNPILIKASNVPISYLLSEGGGDRQIIINQLEGVYSFLEAPGMVINLNFRLQEPLPITSISIEQIDPDNEINLFDW